MRTVVCNWQTSFGATLTFPLWLLCACWRDEQWRDLASTARRQRRRENGMATPIWGNMTLFSRRLCRRIVYANKFLWYSKYAADNFYVTRTLQSL